MTDPLAGASVRFGPEIFRVQTHGGVSRYIVELHRGLLGRGVDSEIVAGLHRSALLDGVPGVCGGRMTAVAGDRFRQAVTKAVDEPLAAWAARRLAPGDVWHPSYFPRRLPGPGGPITVITVYDMIHERYPEAVSPRDDTIARKAAACRSADLVLCISHDTADDAAERLGLDRGRLVVTHLGVSPVEPAEVTAPAGGAPYLVSVGERGAPHKNWPTVLRALAAVRADDLHLVCIGAPLTAAEHASIAAAGLTGRVRAMAASDTELAGVLRGAVGLVYPSRYEGFGLPPLEALAQGCPVVASDVGAIREVVGGIALLVEPTVEGVAAGIDRLLAGGQDVERQRRDGPAHAARFSWEATVDATVAAYRTALDR